jgi:hypothetical protein
MEMAREVGDATTDTRGRETFVFDCYGLEAFAKLVREEAAAQRTWVGLTDKDIQSIHDTYHKRMGPMEFARAIETKLKEKNA